MVCFCVLKKVECVVDLNLCVLFLDRVGGLGVGNVSRVVEGVEAAVRSVCLNGFLYGLTGPSVLLDFQSKANVSVNFWVVRG